MVKDRIVKCSKNLPNVSFKNKISFCLLNSLRAMNGKYKGNKFDASNTLFPYEALLELIMRKGEGINCNYSPDEINALMVKCLQELYNSQNDFLHDFKAADILAGFSLWQFEEQEDIFIKFYRYNFFFNYQTESIDTKSIFVNKFGTTYQEYMEFAYLIYAIGLLGIDILNRYHGFIQKIIDMYPQVVNHLKIGNENYRTLSETYCPDINKIAFSLKVSYSYPIICYNNNLYIPLPHIVTVACTKSLLYRLTDGDDMLRKNIGKENMEEYVYQITNQSNVYDDVRREIVYYRKKQEYRTPDVLCFKDENMVAIECKLHTPASSLRILTQETLDKAKTMIIDDLVKLYKALFVNYPNQLEGIPHIDKNERYGILITLERFDFLHSEIMESVAKRLSLAKEEKDFLNKHIRFDCLYNYETFAFSNGNLINEIKYMNENNKTFDFSISHTTCLKEHKNEEFLEFKNNLLNIVKSKEFESRFLND